MRILATPAPGGKTRPKEYPPPTSKDNPGNGAKSGNQAGQQQGQNGEQSR